MDRQTKIERQTLRRQSNQHFRVKHLDPGLGRKAGVNGILEITGEFDYGVSMVMLSDRCFLGVVMVL